MNERQTDIQFARVFDNWPSSNYTQSMDNRSAESYIGRDKERLGGWGSVYISNRQTDRQKQTTYLSNTQLNLLHCRTESNSCQNEIRERERPFNPKKYNCQIGYLNDSITLQVIHRKVCMSKLSLDHIVYPFYNPPPKDPRDTTVLVDLVLKNQSCSIESGTAVYLLIVQMEFYCCADCAF